MSISDEVKYEDERRWLLLNGMIDTHNNQIERVESIERITQFYVATKVGSLRYRTSLNQKTGKHTYTETYKAPKEFSRGAEHESEIPHWVSEMMFSSQIGSVIKTRTTLTVQGWQFELDEFCNECSGLVIVELEFRADAKMDAGLVSALHNDYLAEILPECFGHNIEITGDSSYSNYKLATTGVPNQYY